MNIKVQILDLFLFLQPELFNPLYDLSVVWGLLLLLLEWSRHLLEKVPCQPMKMCNTGCFDVT